MNIQFNYYHWFVSSFFAEEWSNNYLKLHKDFWLWFYLLCMGSLGLLEQCSLNSSVNRPSFCVIGSNFLPHVNSNHKFTSTINSKETSKAEFAWKLTFIWKRWSFAITSIAKSELVLLIKTIVCDWSFYLLHSVEKRDFITAHSEQCFYYCAWHLTLQFHQIDTFTFCWTLKIHHKTHKKKLNCSGWEVILVVLSICGWCLILLRLPIDSIKKFNVRNKDKIQKSRWKSTGYFSGFTRFSKRKNQVMNKNHSLVKQKKMFWGIRI